MASNTSFSDLIQKALLSQGPDRQNAEESLIQMRNNDYKNYLIEAVKVIIDKQYQGNLRQAAGTLIKSSASLQNNGQINWDYVEESVQNHAKQALLNTLIDQDPLARLAAADAISTICSIELPRNKWVELITSLGQNSDNPDNNVKKTAIQTLGFICEKLKDSAQQGAGFQLQDSVIENILMGIVNGMKQEQQDTQIKVTSITALRNAIGYLQTYFEKENVRTFVFDQILGCLVNQQDEIVIEAIQTLIEFVKIQYNHMGTQTNNGNYTEKLFNLLTPHLCSKKEDIVIPATEIFNTLATEYKDRLERAQLNKVDTQVEVNVNYLLCIKDNLMQNLLQNLLIKSDDDDEPESQIQITTEETLSAVIEVLGLEVIEICKTFISNTAAHQDWSYKQACCLSFSALLDCPVSDQIQQMLYASLSVFVQMLTDNNLFLVFSASKFLAKASDLHASTILKSANLSQDLVIILKSLQQKPSISRNICWILCFLSEQIKDNLDSPFALQITQVIEELMKNALRNDLGNVKDLSVIDCSFMGIMNLLQHSPNTQVSAQYLNHSMQHFESSYQLQGAKKENIQQGILATIHASLLSIQDEFGTNQSQEAASLIDNIYKLIVKHFQTKGDVDSDGIYVISALATCAKEQFANYLDQAWPYINHALQKQIDGDLFKSAIGSIADIARACGSAFNKHVDIVDTLIQCIKLPDFQRELKLHVYVCLGDVILACKEQTTKFIPSLIETFKLGFDATKYMLQSGNANEVEYAENLQDRIIESYTCMLHGINDQSPNPAFKPGFQDLLDFILFTTDKKYHPTIDYIRNCFTLIIDIANFYGQEVTSFVKSDTTNYLYQLLQKYRHIQENEQMIQYGSKILQSF